MAAFLNQSAPDVGPEARRAAAERLVDQQLIRNEMRIGAYPQPTGAEIDDMLGNLQKEHFGGDEARYRAALTKYGISEDQLRRHIAWQLATIRFTDLRFSPAVAGIPDGNGQSANRAAPGADVDQQMESWLKQTRAATKVQFKPGAFQ